MKELISVIVPIYNTQKFLRKCVDSILQQSYGNLEIILVNDGSTDESGKICDEYAEKDFRIKVIHQKNKGLSGARNTGIENSKGKYLAFVDSDDYIKKDMIEVLHQAMTEDVDIVICDVEYVSENGIKLERMFSPIENNIFSRKELINKLFENQSIYYVIACNKLYRRELWNVIRYPIGMIHEDEAVVHHIFDMCNKGVTVKNTCYYYRQVNNSIVHNVNVKRTDRYYALADRLVFLQDKVSKENLKLLSYQYFYHYLEDYFKYSLDKKNEMYISRMKRSFNKAMPVMIRCGFFTVKDAVSLRIFQISPKLYKKLFMK